MYLDDDLLAAFRSEAWTLGIGYQTLINESLRETLARAKRNAGVDAVAEPLPAIRAFEGRVGATKKPAGRAASPAG